MGSDSPAGGAAHAAQEAGGRGATGGLSGARAQRECDVPPRLEVRRRARQMQNHAADRADDVDPQDSGRYKVANCTQAQPVFYGFAGLPDGKVILVSVPSFSSRSRSHVTWLRAHAVRAARNRSSCMST